MSNQTPGPWQNQQPWAGPPQQWTGRHPHQPGPYGPPWPQPPQQPPPRGSDKATFGCVGILILSVLMIAIAVVNGDSGSSTRTAVTTPADTPYRSDSEREYLTLVRVMYPKYEDTPDQVLLDVADAACADLRDGVNFYTVGLTLVAAADIGPSESGYIIGAAVGAVCPDQKSKLPDREEN